MTATCETATPRAWVGCLACYNTGRLVGDWVDGIDAGDFVPCTGRGHEEWWVFDFEGYLGALSVECSPVEAQRIAEALQATEEYPPAAVAAWIANGCDDLDDLADAYLGEWDSLEAYAEQWLEDAGMLDQVPEGLRSYIDVRAYARDLQFGGDVWTADAAGHGGTGVFVFRAV